MAGARMKRIVDTVERVSGRAVAQPSGPFLRYGLPATVMVAALLLANLSQVFLPGGGVFLVLLLPVIVLAAALGFVPGLVALLTGAAGAFLLVPIGGHPWLADASHLARLALYLVAGSLVLTLAAVLHRSLLRARHRPVLTLPPTRSLEPLTDREREVLALAATGLSTRAIGERLFLSENTIKSHLARIYGKLGARNRAEAVSAGLQAGWISADALPSQPEPEEVE